MYSKAQLKISLCEPSPQSDRYFCHCADHAAIYLHVHHCLVVLEVCAPDTRLTLAVDITSPQEYIRTLTVREWRSALLPEMDKRPAIFILG